MYPITSVAQKRTFRQAAAVIAVICVLNLLATLFYWYSTIWWFDILMHFLGGFFIGLLAYWISTSFIPARFLPTTIMGWISVLILSVCIIGFLWEAYELVVDLCTGAQGYGYLDGISDMFNDLSGGFFSVIAIFLFPQRDSTVN